MELNKKGREPEGGTGQSLKEDKEREEERGRRASKEGQSEKGKGREKGKRGDTIRSHLFRTSTHKDILVSASITS